MKIDQSYGHGSYSGDDVISNDLLDTYTRSISKPGFLRAQMQYFAAAFSDAAYFQSRFGVLGKLRMPVMTLGGEASFAPSAAQIATFTPLVDNLTTAVIPKAGHWIVGRLSRTESRSLSDSGLIFIG